MLSDHKSKQTRSTKYHILEEEADNNRGVAAQAKREVIRINNSEESRMISDSSTADKVLTTRTSLIKIPGAEIRASCSRESKDNIVWGSLRAKRVVIRTANSTESRMNQTFRQEKLTDKLATCR